jgi:hypothetical protein
MMRNKKRSPIDCLTLGVEVKNCRDCNRGDCETCGYKIEFKRLMEFDDKTSKGYKQQYAQKRWQLKNAIFYAKLKELMSEEELKTFLSECDKKVEQEFPSY